MNFITLFQEQNAKMKPWSLNSAIYGEKHVITTRQCNTRMRLFFSFPIYCGWCSRDTCSATLLHDHLDLS